MANTQKMDTNYSVDIADGYNTTKIQAPKRKDNDLDPLQALNKEEGQQVKKMLEQQMEYQRKGLEKIIDEERQSKKQEIQSLKKLHEEQMRKKLQLKDYQIQKLK